MERSLPLLPDPPTNVRFADGKTVIWDLGKMNDCIFSRYNVEVTESARAHTYLKTLGGTSIVIENMSILVPTVFAVVVPSPFYIVSKKYSKLHTVSKVP